jgi:tetratricopeptide (TPR) repeat protein
MLVGVGLTQLTMAPSYLRRTADWLGSSVDLLSNFHHPFGAVAMAATVVFYVTMGFIIGHLITQLWVFGALTMAKRQADDPGHAIQVLQAFRMPAPKLDVLAGTGSGETPQVQPSADLKRAAAQVLRQSEAEFKTASDLAARGRALAIDGEDEKAATYFERAAALDPGNPEYLLDQARALAKAEEYLRAIAPLERAYELSKNDAGKREQVVLEIMFNGLYADDQRGFEKAIEYGEPLGDRARSENISIINRFLACAYGQKFSFNKRTQKLADDDLEQKKLCEAALAAIKRDLDSLSVKERAEERDFLLGMLRPTRNAEDDDLKDFAQFPEFRKLIEGQGRSR